MKNSTIVHAIFLAYGLAVMSAPSAFACMGDEYNSVHFHSGKPDWGILPKRGAERGDDRPGKQNFNGEGQRWGVELKPQIEERTINNNHLLIAGDNALRAGNWGRAIENYRLAEKRYGRRGFSSDRIRLTNELQKISRPDKGLLIAIRDYTRGVTYSGTYDGKTLSLLAANTKNVILRDHASYQLACALAAAKSKVIDVPFAKYLSTFPHGRCREEALIMQARAAILPGNVADRKIEIGRTSLGMLLNEFPGSRFLRARLGLLGRICFLDGRYKDSLPYFYSIGDMYSIDKVAKQLGPFAPADLKARQLAGYLRRLASAATYEVYSDTLGHIKRIRAGFSISDSQVFAKLLKSDLSLMAPYLYVRVYHNENREKELRQIARFAEEIAHIHPISKLPPIVQVRLAEIWYQLHQSDKAIAWADRAIKNVNAGQRSPFKDAQNIEAAPRAKYVRCASLFRLRKYGEAIQGFEAILRDYPETPLRRSVREELARLYERTENLNAALDQYFALGYGYDVAYILDVRMATPQVESYAAKHSGGSYSPIHRDFYYDLHNSLPDTRSRNDLLNYTLGIRYLREERLDLAARSLRKVPRSLYTKLHDMRQDEGVCPDPLTAVREIKTLKQQIDTVSGANAKAKAMYRYASYYYTHSTLLLYNPMLWEHSRAINFDFYWNDSIATDRDDIAVVAHMLSHETYAHTLEICRTIAKRYPASPTAPQALYRAACAAYHLSNLNGWWREEDEGHDHKKEASNLMSRIVKTYPESAFRHSATKYATVFAGGRNPKTYRRKIPRSARYHNPGLPRESPMVDFAPALSNKSAMSKSPFQ